MELLRKALELYSGGLHMPLVLLLCAAGSGGHLLAIWTLRSLPTPTNAFLISMSCSQLLLCVNFLYSTFFKWASDEMCWRLFFSKFLVRSMHFSVTLSVLVHMAGVFHVVALSVIRYCSLRSLMQANNTAPWFTYTKLRIIVISIYGSVCLIGIPLYFTSEVVEMEENEGCAARFPSLSRVPAYQLHFSSLPYLTEFNFWIFNLCSKIIPSVLLCIMTWLILARLQAIKSACARFASARREQQHHRTTIMILLIMFAFICVELPQGILAILATVTDIDIFYVMGDFNELVTLLTSCLIFALFCAMNSRLRHRVKQLSFIRIAVTVGPRRTTTNDKLTTSLIHDDDRPAPTDATAFSAL